MLQFYRAIVNSTDQSGAYCYVSFPDYGNIEQVVISDIRPVPKYAWVSYLQSKHSTLKITAAYMAANSNIVVA